MPEIETLLIANHAESHDGLLHVMGAGWSTANQVSVNGQVPPLHFGIGLLVLVGWNETNERHRVLIYVEPEDGGTPLLRLEAELEMGRPPGVTAGMSQRAVLAFSGEAVFTEAGGYRLVAELGDQTRFVSFRIVHSEAAPTA
jgi:hypothetical protein